MISRRKFILSSAAIGLGAAALAGSVISGSRITTSDLQLSKDDIYLPQLPDAFDGLRIGFLSDCHLGPCGSIDLLDRSISLLETEKPDLLILGGDYILVLDLFSSRWLFNNFSSASAAGACSKKRPDFKEYQEIGQHYFFEAASRISRINPAHGIIAVLGNHDRWNSAANCTRIFEQHGIEMLINRSITLQRASHSLEFYGSDDYGTGLPEGPASENPSRILITHNPDFLSEIAGQNLFALGLAGHTHGGQINLPLVGPIALNIQDRQLIQGLKSISGSQIMVSSGVGISGLPWRINCPPEVNLITLRAGKRQIEA